MNGDNFLICPVCGKKLYKENRSFFCENRHCFDMAKEGYVNLLTGKHKSGELIGDNKSMAQSRRQFLNKNYFSALSDTLISLAKKYAPEKDAVCCDICCGEGYYSDKLLGSFPCTMLCFDISREMVRLCAKRKNGSTCFVASSNKIPIENSSVDFAFHLFAPFFEDEFLRIIKDGGVLLTAVAGENHLFELKQALYESPYKNDEAPPETKKLKLLDKVKVSKKIALNQKQDIDDLFKMTPYYYHTSDNDKSKLESLNQLKITTEFVIYIYKK
ncbi:MAG: putative RNA methyltransferase [Acutalibacteraceae bacterium]